MLVLVRVSYLGHYNTAQQLVYVSYDRIISTLYIHLLPACYMAILFMGSADFADKQENGVQHYYRRASSSHLLQRDNTPLQGVWLVV